MGELARHQVRGLPCDESFLVPMSSAQLSNVCGQGFASGDAEHDAWAIRRFVTDGHCIALAQSFAKNFGLYGERIGALSVVCNDAKEVMLVSSSDRSLVQQSYMS